MDQVSMSKYLFVALLSLRLFTEFAEGNGPGLGVTLATNAHNLPSPDQIRKLLEEKNKTINKIRLYEANHEMLKALNSSAIEVLIGVKNEDVTRIASSYDEGVKWVNEYIVPYAPYIRFHTIVVGDKLIPDSSLAPSVVPAIQNLKLALSKANLKIYVSISITPSVLSATLPPSTGAFNEKVIPMILPILQLVGWTPLLFDVYPYYTYTTDPRYNEILPLSYALLDRNPGFKDGDLVYTNILDSLVDALRCAIDKIQVGRKRIYPVIVSETGWPSSHGTVVANPHHASIYTMNLVSRALKARGTPKYPNLPLFIYAHTLFVQDQEVGDKAGFGLYYSNMTAAFPLLF